MRARRFAFEVGMPFSLPSFRRCNRDLIDLLHQQRDLVGVSQQSASKAADFRPGYPGNRVLLQTEYDAQRIPLKFGRFLTVVKAARGIVVRCKLKSAAGF